MKIRDRLSISFSLVASLSLLFFGFAIYFFFSQYRKSEFNNRLKQRVEVTEKMFLEKENFSTEAFRTIQEQFLNKLPEETEEVVLLSDTFRNELKQSYPEEFLNDLVNNKEAYFESGDTQGAGRIFHVRGEDYLVLLTAVDYIGIRLMDHFLTIIFIGLLACILAIIGVSYLISGIILNPILQKIKKANSISATNLHERLQVGDPDNELGQLAIAFNKLLDRVAEAFEIQRSFIDSASHEIRNPLTAIIGEAEFALERDRSKEEYIQSLKTISEEADRLNTLVNSLLNLSSISAKRASIPMETFSIVEVVRSSLEKLNFLNPEHQVVLVKQPGHTISITGSKHLLETALINLMDNACKFSFNKPVEVEVETINDEMVVIIRDQGIGIPAEDIPKVTQPFHRADNARKISGIGIGIPLTSKIIELHGGTLNFTSELNKGTVARVTLPVKR